MKKINLLIGIIITMLLLGCVIIWYINYKKNLNPELTQNNDQNIELPTSDPRDGILKISNANDQNQVKDSFDQYVKQEIADYPGVESIGITSSMPIEDFEGNLVNLDFFLDSVEAKINPHIREMIGNNYYSLFYCVNEDNQKEYGITFDVGDEDLTKLEKTEIAADQYMRQWEPYILSDLHKIIFPEDIFSENDLKQSLIFQDGEFRYAMFKVKGESFSINYTVDTSVINRVVVSTSKSCIRKSIENLFDF